MRDRSCGEALAANREPLLPPPLASPASSDAGDGPRCSPCSPAAARSLRCVMDVLRSALSSAEAWCRPPPADPRCVERMRASITENLAPYPEVRDRYLADFDRAVDRERRLSTPFFKQPLRTSP